LIQIGSIKKRDAEEEDLVATLYEQINRFKATQANLVEKNNLLKKELEKKKKEVVSARNAQRRTIGQSVKANATTDDQKQPVGLPKVEVVPGPTMKGSGERTPSTSHHATNVDASLLERLGI
jgi:hypothetical protein